jgi:MFS family permease
MSDSSRGYRPIFFVVIVAGLFCFVSMNLLSWSFPLHVQQLVVAPAAIGLVMGSMGVTAVLLRPFAGHWGDRRGRRMLLLLGALGFALAPVLYAWSTSTVMLVIGRLVQGAGISLFTTGYGALVADLAPEGRRGQAIGFSSLGSPFSLIVGPRLGVAIQAAAGLPALFYASAGVALVGLVLLLAAPTRSLHGSLSDVVDYRFSDALRSSKLSAMMVAILALSLAYGAAVTYMPLFATEQGVANGDLFFVAFGAALMIVAASAGQVSDRVGRTRVIVPGMLGLAACLVLLGSARSLPAMLVVALVWGVCSGAAKTSLDAYTIDCAPVSGRGSAVGLEYLIFDLGAGLGVIPLGALAGAVGYGAMYAVVGGICLVGMVAYVVISRKNGVPATGSTPEEAVMSSRSCREEA